MSAAFRRAGLRWVPAVDDLEDRKLLSTVTQNQAYRVSEAWHKYHQYVSELQHIELKSQATQEQSNALSDAARTLANEASSGGPSAQARTVSATQQLDQAPLYGWLGDSGWSQIRARLTTTLGPLQVPSAAIDQAIAAMQSVAHSAGVTYSDYETLTDKEGSYERARSSVRNTTSHFPDPETYYTQHLRGFFRGGAVSHRDTRSGLNADLKSIASESGDTAAQSAVLHRDVQLLQRVGATLTSQAFGQFSAAYVNAFVQGAPNAATQQALGAQFQTILGSNALGTTRAAANQLVADTPAFFQAAGSSQVNVEIIVTDVQNFVANGGGAAPNPFKIQIPRGT